MLGTYPLVWPMQYRGDERTRVMLERATHVGTPEEEALHETHGMVSQERADAYHAAVSATRAKESQR